MNDLIQNVVSLLEAVSRERKVSIRLSLNESLPPLLVDGILIEQVLVNLIRNGFEAMDETPVEHRKLIIRSFVEDSLFVKIEVSDRGTGLTEEEYSKIYDSFYSTKSEGLGMGLSICKSTIENHGGQLGAVANKSGGTTFYFTLPIKQAESVAS